MKSHETPRSFEKWHLHEIDRNDRDTERRQRILAHISMRNQLSLFPVEEGELIPFPVHIKCEVEDLTA
jgi:hypothetical protein